LTGQKGLVIARASLIDQFCENLEKREDSTVKLPIRPWQRPTNGIIRVPLREIDRGVDVEQTIEFPESVTAYLDVLGFSHKKKAEDIEMTLQDFAGPLAVCANAFGNIRYNVFSDCAFVTTPVENAAQLLSSIRFAFTQWAADSVLVRGGIALGSYREIHGTINKIAPRNFFGNFFAGSAVTEAVRMEGSGTGALLFASDDCAELYREKYAEPLFYRPGAKIIGWSDSSKTLYWFVGVSLLRLLKILSTEDGLRHFATPHLLSNIRYSLEATNGAMKLVVLAILSWPKLSKKAKEEAVGLLEIKDQDFRRFQKNIDGWLSDEKAIKLLITFANFDSSIIGSL
jgi:hypothetical protein